MSEASNPVDLVPNGMFTAAGIAGAVLLVAAALVAVTAWMVTEYRNRHKSKNPIGQHIPSRQRRFDVVTVVKLLIVPGITLLMVWMAPAVIAPTGPMVPLVNRSVVQ